MSVFLHFSRANVLLMIVCTLVCVPLRGAQRPEIKGNIKIEGQPDNMPQFRILFNGKETLSDKEGMFTIPLDPGVALSNYSLLICQNIRQNFDKTNTVRNVGVQPTSDYRYFECERASWGNVWLHVEKKLSNEQYAAPERTLIVLLDPQYFDHIETWRIHLPPSVIKLPVVTLKKTISSSQLAHASARSVLESLDATPFHESVTQHIKKVVVVQNTPNTPNNSNPLPSSKTNVTMLLNQ
jgi:hypothetical protein